MDSADLKLTRANRMRACAARYGGAGGHGVERGAAPRRRRRQAFTLIELLVVIAIVAAVLGLLLPAIGAARRATMAAVCASNLRQLGAANAGYAAENGDYLVPAATDIWDVGGGLHRWHGVRESGGPAPGAMPFDPARGPLAAFLADGRVKICPTFAEFARGTEQNAYESGAGGYGYNQYYVGSRHWAEGYYFQSPGQLLGTLTTEIFDPARVVMFTDAAMPQMIAGALLFTEESFCYPPHFLDEHGNEAPDWGLASPDIHFRHDGRTQVTWSDGHVGEERMTFTLDGPNVYGADVRAARVGWFGEPNNRRFHVQPQQ